jgi:hypothetical protein
VTAVVLKQAAGKVRCGGCGNAFNALAYLSESKPDLATRTEPDGSLPELTPDSREAGSDKQPQTISAEQSAALLKTLDQLAGEDVRLEDTGIEWRVMTEDEDDGPIDEILERAPTQVDQFLTKTPTEVEAGEIFDDPDQASVDAVEVFEGADTPATQTSAEELRFDDNTGLPDDFDFDSAQAAVPALQPEPEPEPEPEVENVQVDLALGDPDEWGDLLDEVTPPPEPEPVIEVDAKSEAEVEVPAAEEIQLGDDSAGDALVLDDDKPLDIDTQFGLQAEAMGIDLSGIHKSGDGEHAEQLELAATGEVDASAIDDEEIAALADVESDAGAAEFPDSTGALEFELAKAQSAAERIEEELAALESGEIGAEIGEETSIDDDLMAAAFETERSAIEAMDENLAEDAAQDSVEEPIEELIEEFIEAGEDETGEDVDDAANALHLELDVVEDIDTEEPIADLDGPFDEKIAGLEIRLDDERQTDDVVAAVDEHVVPEPTEEEQTINMQIDQELLSMAVEDEEGFASTIVFENKSGTADPEAEAASRAKEAALLEKLKESGSGFETIVMEGDAIRSAREQEKLEEERDASGGRPVPGFVLPAEELPEPPPSSARKYSMIAGVLVLVLLLCGQLVHQSRAELAKISAINSIIGPIYRAFGAPIAPNWDVSGWTIQKSTGTTRPISAIVDGVPELAPEADLQMVNESTGLVGGASETLTIYSRIANEGDRPLPYPLINVELIDRFQSTLGSTVLQPSNYLTGSFDTRAPVAVSGTFDAVITIESPSVEATGFKVNVCYRNSDGLLRCAIETFK